MENLKLANQENASLEEEVRRVLHPQGVHVHVVAWDQFVNLSGDVNSSALKRQLDSMVWAVPGVKNVVNHLRVSSLG